MLTARYACINQTLSGRRHVVKWVCVWIFLLSCAHFPHKAVSSWFARRVDLPADDHPSASGYSVLPWEKDPETAPAPDDGTDASAGEGSSQENSDLTEVYHSLTALRQKFVSVVEKKRHPEWVTDVGLTEVTRCFSMAARKVQEVYERYDKDGLSGDPSKYQDVIPEGHSVSLLSAATGQINQYTFRRRHPSWVLEGPRGDVYEFNMWALDKDRPSYHWTVRRVPGFVEDALAVVDVFGVRTLQQVEAQFGVEVIQDILVHPTWSPHLSFPDGVFLNFIALWKPADVSLYFVAHTLDSHSSEVTDAVMMDKVEMARLNLTFQLVQLVGRIALHGVLLTRFQVSDFSLQSCGYVSFRPRKVSRMKEHQSPASESAAAAGSEGHRAAWPSFDRFVNAKDLARVVLFLWCPTEALHVSLFISSPTTEKIEEVLRQCLSMPDEVAGLVSYIFYRNADAGQVVRSDIPKRLQRRLLQLAKS